MAELFFTLAELQTFLELEHLYQKFEYTMKLLHDKYIIYINQDGLNNPEILNILFAHYRNVINEHDLIDFEVDYLNAIQQARGSRHDDELEIEFILFFLEQDRIETQTAQEEAEDARQRNERIDNSHQMYIELFI